MPPDVAEKGAGIVELRNSLEQAGLIIVREIVNPVGQLAFEIYGLDS